jgi:hypothetical protein
VKDQPKVFVKKLLIRVSSYEMLTLREGERERKGRERGEKGERRGRMRIPWPHERMERKGLAREREKKG